MGFIRKIDEDRIRLCAAGLFSVGMHLIPPVSVTHLKSNFILMFIFFS